MSTTRIHQISLIISEYCLKCLHADDPWAEMRCKILPTIGNAALPKDWVDDTRGGLVCKKFLRKASTLILT